MGTNFKNLVLWVATTIGSVAIGAVFTAWYQSSRPEVRAVEIRPSVAGNARFVKEQSKVAVPSSLDEALRSSNWAPDFGSSNVSYKEMMTTLDDAEDRLQTFLDRWAKFKSDLPRLRYIAERSDQASADERNEFFDLWERNDPLIYASLLGSYRRGAIDVPATDHPHGKQPVFMIDRDRLESGDELWVVHKKGGSHGSVLAPKTRSDLAFSRQVAEALAYFDTRALLQFLDLVQKPETEGVTSNENALAEVRRVRTGLSRWSVSVAIANRGGSPLAFLPFAILQVDTTDLLVNGKRLGKHLQIRLEHRNTDSEPAPIYIDKGNAALTTFVSTDFIKEIETAPDLVKAYDQGLLNCSLRLFSASGDVFTKDSYETPPVKFGAIENSIMAETSSHNR